MKVGTKSLLFGAHSFLHHPWLLAVAWTKLYGIPWHPALWLCFFVHDIGYLGLDKMDDERGEEHPYVGANIVRKVFGDQWGDFCLLHSRFLSKRLGRQYSRLCVADKLAFVLTPRWLFLTCTKASGELQEYFYDDRDKYTDENLDHSDLYTWHRDLRNHVANWVKEHKDCTSKDTI